jgi:hypothetical protein
MGYLSVNLQKTAIFLLNISSSFIETMDIFNPSLFIYQFMSVFSKIIFLVCLIIQGHYYCIAQNTQVLSYTGAYDLKAHTDQVLGPDDLLVNGKSYLPANLRASGSPDFEYSLNEGSGLFIKGQYFDNIRLALDIVSDQLILVQEYGSGLENRIALHTAYADSFLLGNRLFIYLSSPSKGYFEKIAGGKVAFLKKYSKEYVKIYDASNRGKYSEQKFVSFLLSEGRLVQVNGRMSFLNYFRNNKKPIRDYLRTNKISVRNGSNSQLTALMNYCNSLSDEKN